MTAIIVFGIVLAALLGAIAWIDFQRLIIPDALNLGLAAAGLAYQAQVSTASLWLNAATGAAIFSALWLIRRAHSNATGRIGLGLGDVKMAGASAVWLNPWNLPAFIFIASFSALIFALGRRMLPQNGTSIETRYAFGPFLAAGLLLTWLGEQQFPYLAMLRTP
jgi:leader peptidase (prepilin peptidase) / N-methyltransferase